MPHLHPLRRQLPRRALRSVSTADGYVCSHRWPFRAPFISRECRQSLCPVLFFVLSRLPRLSFILNSCFYGNSLNICYVLEFSCAHMNKKLISPPFALFQPPKPVLHPVPNPNTHHSATHHPSHASTATGSSSRGDTSAILREGDLASRVLHLLRKDYGRLIGMHIMLES